MVAWSSSAGAVDVEIHGYPFGCKTPDGETRKPKFGDVGGMYFAGLPQGRKACLETIDRMIYSCGANTTFISHDLNDQYADCLPIFEQQAEWCARHFELQRSKCDSGGSSAPAAEATEAVAEPAVEPANATMWALKRSNLRSGPGTDHAKVGLLNVGDAVQVTGEIDAWLRIEAPGGGEAFVYGPLLTEEVPVTTSASAEPPGRLCSSEGDDSECWREIADNPGCHLWERYSSWYISVSSWSGSCRRGVADGAGTLVERVQNPDLDLDFPVEDVLTILQGKRHGKVVRHFPDTGAVTEGQYSRGTAFGKWVLYSRDGSCVTVTEYSEGLVSKKDWGCNENPDLKMAGSGADLAEEPAEVATASPTADTASTGPLHGSITFSQEADGGYAWGIAWSFDSPAGALAEATDQCREYGGTGCEEAGWFENACGALAVGGGNGYGTGWGDTLAEARRDALTQCRVADCRVEVARCSQSQETGGKGRQQEEDQVVTRELKIALEPQCTDIGAVWHKAKRSMSLLDPRELPSCWWEISEMPGCHVFGLYGLRPVAWSGGCSAGVATGPGELEGSVFRDDLLDGSEGAVASFKASGKINHGKKHGRWVFQFADSSGVATGEGSFQDGLRHGRWVYREPYGESVLDYDPTWIRQYPD